MTAENKLQENLFSHTSKDNRSEPTGGRKESIISWSSIMKICGDEGVVKEIIGIFLRDMPKCVEGIENAIKIKDAQNLKLYAHRLKGASGHAAAEKLSQIAGNIENSADNKDFEAAASVLDVLKDECSTVISFLSRADWIEAARLTESEVDKKENTASVRRDESVNKKRTG